MAIDYDEFRRTTWEERIAIFLALSPAEKAELFRSQISGWLDRHSSELTAPEIALLREAIEMTVPENYVSPPPQELVERMKDFERRAVALLGPARVIEALTMQWGMT